MNKAIILYLFILMNLNIFYTDKKNNEIYSLEELKVNNSNIFPVLDTIIQMKDDTKSFKSTKLFSIEFNGDSIKTDLIFINTQGNQMYYHYPDILGYFNYKKHFFIVRGISIDFTIFQKTNNCRDFNFSIPPTKYTAEGIPILRRYDDFAVWTMRYEQGVFKLLSFFTNDKNDKWFDYIEEEYNEKFN